MIFLASSATILKESLARDIQLCVHSRSRALRHGLSLSIFFIFQELLQSIPSHLGKCNKYLETFTKWKGIERLVCHGNKLEVQTALKLGPGLGPPRVGSRAGGPQVAWGHSIWEYVCSPWQVVAAGASGVCLCSLTRPKRGYMGVWLFTRTRSCVYLSELSVCIPGYEPDTTGVDRHSQGSHLGRLGNRCGRGTH